MSDDDSRKERSRVAGQPFTTPVLCDEDQRSHPGVSRTDGFRSSWMREGGHLPSSHVHRSPSSLSPSLSGFGKNRLAFSQTVDRVNSKYFRSWPAIANCARLRIWLSTLARCFLKGIRRRDNDDDDNDDDDKCAHNVMFKVSPVRPGLH